MDDTHQRPTPSLNAEQQPPYAKPERFPSVEVGRRNSKERGSTKLWVGSLGLGANLLLLWILANATLMMSSVVFLVGLIFALVASASSVWLLKEGLEGLESTRTLPSPYQRRSIRTRSQESYEKPAERQLLEAIESNGEITPARAALQTSLTVDDAEQLQSDLAQRGHLDVRVEGSKLAYSL